MRCWPAPMAGRPAPAGRKEESVEQDRRHSTLEHLDALVGEWETEATHPALPNTVVRGRATFEWLEGRCFLIWRSHHDHPDLPDAIAILGCGIAEGAGPSSDSAGDCQMHYFDSRGVTRVYGLDAEPR